MRLCFTSRDSQKLGDAMIEACEDIKDYFVRKEDHISKLTPEQMYKLKALCKQLDNPTPMTPLGLFSMKQSALLSAFGTSLTYIIVLIQFKTTELPLVRYESLTP